MLVMTCTILRASRLVVKRGSIKAWACKSKAYYRYDAQSIVSENSTPFLLEFIRWRRLRFYRDEDGDGFKAVLPPCCVFDLLIFIIQVSAE